MSRMDKVKDGLAAPEKQIGAVPQLRFKQDDGRAFPSLHGRALMEVTSWMSGGTPSKDAPEFWNGDIPWISASSMHSFRVSQSQQKVTASAIGNGTRIAKRSSVLLLVRGSMLFNRIPVCIAEEDVAFNQDVKALNAINEMDPEFLAYWLTGKEDRLLSMVTGTGIGAGKLDTDEVQSMTVSLPNREEQQKIASFLSSIDTKLDTLRQKKDALTRFMTGLMQKIFSQEIRFTREDGSAFPEWKRKRLGEVAFFTPGIYLAKSHYSGETYSVQGAGSEMGRHSEANAFGPVSVIGRVGTVGRPRFFPEGCWVNNNAAYIEAVPGFVHPVIIHKILEHLDWSNVTAQTAQPFLLVGELLNVSIDLPEDIREQSMIANTFSSLDAKIAAVTTQITQMETFKKGLLQQMFV